MKLDADQLVIRVKKKLQDAVGQQQGEYWTPEDILNNIAIAHEDMVSVAIRAAEDYFGTTRDLDLIAEQAEYSLFEDFLKLRYAERRPDGSATASSPMVESRKIEGVGLDGMMLSSADHVYAIYGDNFVIDPTASQAETAGIRLFVITEPPPPARGTALGGDTAAITLAADASDIDDIYNDTYIRIISGAGAGLDNKRKITDYVGATRVATVDSNWATQPDTTSVYATISKLPSNFHTMLVTGGIYHCRTDRDEALEAFVDIWNSKMEEFEAFLEQRTYAQRMTAVYDPYDGMF